MMFGKLRVLRAYLMAYVLALFIAVPVNAASDDLEKAISEAYRIANDNSHGYSQTVRWGAGL